MTEPALTCLACTRGWEHCHGALLLHPAAAAECSHDEDCRLGEEQHEVAVGCVELGCACAPG